MRLLFVAIWLAALAMCGPVRAESKLVRIEGKEFIQPDGRVLHIKGINLGNWLMPEGYMFGFEVAKSPRQIYSAFERLLGAEKAADFWSQFRDRFVQEGDVKFIKSVGFNTVRVPLHYGLFMTDDGILQGPGWALLDRLVGWAHEAGLYVIPDLHAAPGGQTGINHDDGPGYPLMFYLPHDQDLTVKLWRAIAERYRSEPAILGYDLLNEPIAPYHDTSTLNPRLEPFYKRVTAAIREVDPERIVFLEGGQWASNLDMLGPPFARNLAYSYHSFWASTKRDSIQRHLNFSERYDVPLFLGETGELTDEWNRRFRELNEAHGIGWCFWTYKNLESPSTVVSINKPEGWDEVVAFVDGRRASRPDEELLDFAIREYLRGTTTYFAELRGSYVKSLGLRLSP